MNLLGIALKLDSDLVRLQPDSPNNLLGDNSAAGGIATHRLMVRVGWARVVMMEMRNGLTRDMP